MDSLSSGFLPKDGEERSPFDHTLRFEISDPHATDGGIPRVYDTSTVSLPPTVLAARCFAPFLTQSGLVIALADWIQHIPRNPTWSHATSQGRIEDGGSLCSAAVWAVPQHHDILKALRLRWHQ